MFQLTTRILREIYLTLTNLLILSDLMRTDITNIYQILPLPNDIKFLIYNIMYKKYYTIPNNLKQDIITFFYIEHIIRFYQSVFETDIEDSNYYLILLYHDLVHCHFSSVPHSIHNSLFFDHDSLFIHRYHTTNEQFLIKRIKHFWRLLSIDKRLQFHNSMLINFD